MKQRRYTPLLIIFLLVLPIFAACSRIGVSEGPTVVPSVTPAAVASQNTVVEEDVPQATTAVPTAPPTAETINPTNTAAAVTPTKTPSPAATADLATVSLDPFDTIVPDRDDIRLAVAFMGAGLLLGTPTVEAPAPQQGDREEFIIGNVDVNTVSTITAVLQGVGRNAYYWYDEGVGGTVPDADELADTIAAFDSIYESVNDQFGDGTPDDDPPVHIVHVSPLALCDVDLSTFNQCGLAGYFSSQDELPNWVSPNSNEREMFVMNSTQIGTESYLDVLAHELRHLIEARFDQSDADWAVEGSAMLAAQLAGYDNSAQYRGNVFLTDPDLQLNTWSASNSLPHYGQGYLMSRFLYDQLGPDVYRSVATSLSDGLDAVTEANPDGMDGLTLWKNWLVAMALTAHRTGVPPEFQWSGPALEPAATTNLDTLPEQIDTTVSQYAADYYQLPSSGAYSIAFEGDVSTPLLPVTAPSGESVWYALRNNYSNPRLTRSVDLRDVTSATLEYEAYVDIEEGYDFAYVSVSDDGGTTWQPLTADGMQGLEEQDDPSQSAVAERFYTGQLQQWISESVDLTPYTGKEIDLRFEYVTDPILTYGGFAVDDIRIPEIDFADDAESAVEGWTAEGFARVPLTVAQSWILWLITFHDGEIQAQSLAPDAGGNLTVLVKAIAGERAPILIVAGFAPQILETAEYRLFIES